MDFWGLIDSGRSGARTCCDVAANATTLLASHPPSEIVAAHQTLQGLLRDSYVHRLQAAAHVMMDGCTDDSFDYFRGWLLTCGSEAFLGALTSPDTLADQLRPSWLCYQCEDALYITTAAYERATGSPMPAEAYGALGPQEITWEFDLGDEAELRRRLPRLSALFLN